MNLIKVYLVNTVKSIKSANCEKSVKFAESLKKGQSIKSIKSAKNMKDESACYINPPEIDDI